MSDGNQISKETQTKIYRDSEGRIRTETSFTTPSGAAETRIEIFDPVAGYVALLDAAKLTAFKHTLPAGPHEPPARRERPEVEKTDLGTKTIAGLEATGTRSTRTIPAGAMGNTEAIQIVHETWTSSALKIPVSVTSSDPLHGTSTTQLSSVTQAEPDASLFQIPSSYKVTAATGPAGLTRHGPPPPDGTF